MRTKWLSLCLAVSLCLSACGSHPPTDLNEVREALVAALSEKGITDVLPLEADAVCALYGMEASWVAQAVGLVAMYGAFPDEVILTEAVDTASAAKIAECLELHLNDVLAQAETYDPESYAAASACTVERDGRYVALILSASADALRAVYTEQIRR